MRQTYGRYGEGVKWRGMSPWLLNVAERGGSGAQHTALATVVKIAEARSWGIPI